MPTTFGNITPPAIFLTVEAHKLHLTFTVATGASVYPGQNVKLTATGSITPCVAGDTGKDRIGVSTHKRITGDTDQPFPYLTAGEEATIIMRGYTTINAQANAALVPGPIKFAALNVTGSGNTSVGTSRYIQSVGGDAECDGWSLDVATAQGDPIRVVLR